MIDITPQANELLAELDSLIGLSPGPADLKKLGIEAMTSYTLGSRRSGDAFAEFARAARRAAEIADALTDTTTRTAQTDPAEPVGERGTRPW